MKDLAKIDDGTRDKVKGDPVTAADYVEFTTEFKNVAQRDPNLVLSEDDLTQVRQGVEYLDASGFVGQILGATDTTNATALASLDGAAPLDAPTLTGVPIAPTAAAGTDTTQVATTAFVRNAPIDASGFSGLMTSADDTIQEAFDTLDAVAAPLASPTLTGIPAAPAPSTGDDSTQLATTAFVEDTAALVTYIPATRLCTGAGQTNVITDNTLGVWTMPDAATSTGCATIGPFVDADVITGFSLYYYGDGAGVDAVDLDIYIGAYATGDDVTSPNEESRASWSLAMPTNANEFTKVTKALLTDTLTVAAGDMVSVFIERDGSGDAYNDSFHLVGIDVEFQAFEPESWVYEGNSLRATRLEGKYIATSEDVASPAEVTSGIVNDFTFATWVYVSKGASSGNAPIVNFVATYGGGTGQDITLKFDMTAQKFMAVVTEEGSDRKVYRFITTFVDDTWWHAAMTWEGGETDGTLLVYINGVAQTPTIAEDDNVVLTSSTHWMGISDFTTSHQGDILEVMVWNEALGAAELAELAADETINPNSNTGDYTSSANLVHFWCPAMERALQFGFDYSNHADRRDLDYIVGYTNDDIVANAP